MSTITQHSAAATDITGLLIFFFVRDNVCSESLSTLYYYFYYFFATPHHTKVSATFIAHILSYIANDLYIPADAASSGCRNSDLRRVASATIFFFTSAPG